jgi:hypothetical protein
MTLEEIKLRAVQDALRRHGGHKPSAALELGVSLKTIYNWLAREVSGVSESRATKSVKLRPNRRTVLTLPSGEHLVLRGRGVGGHVAVLIEGPAGMEIENVREGSGFRVQTGNS